MNKLSNVEKERLKKINDTFLYNMGYEHVNIVCDETDRLLKKYKDIEESDNLNQWFIGYSKELERKEKLKRISKKARKYSKGIAIVLIIISMLGAIITMSVEAFRVRFLNTIIESSQKFSLVSHEEQDENSLIHELPANWLGCYYPTFLPKNYTLVSAREFNDVKHMIFSGPNCEEVKFIQGGITSQSQIDTENSDVMEIDIQGNRGFLVKKADITIINWTNSDKSFSIQGNIDKSKLQEIAESLGINN